MTDSQGATKSSVADPTTQVGDVREYPADATARAVAQPNDAVVRRTRDGWRVGDSDVPDLTSAMALADLISAELDAGEDATQETAAAPWPPASQAGRRTPQGPRLAGCGPLSASSSTHSPRGSGSSRPSGCWPNGTGSSPGRHSSSSGMRRGAAGSG